MSEKVVVEYPIGHRRRRQEGIPKLIEKFENSLKTRFPKKQVAQLMELCGDHKRLEETAVSDFMKLLVI